MLQSRMAFRYKLLPFGASDTPDDLLTKIFTHDAGSGTLLGDGSPKRPWNAVVDHLRAIGVQTLLVQNGVRDPDFIEEHQAFYSKQHRPINPTCVRVHVFSCGLAASLDPSREPDALVFLDGAVANPESYLGFVTIRPLRHAPVGATILRPSE